MGNLNSKGKLKFQVSGYSPVNPPSALLGKFVFLETNFFFWTQKKYPNGEFCFCEKCIKMCLDVLQTPGNMDKISMKWVCWHFPGTWNTRFLSLEYACAEA